MTVAVALRSANISFDKPYTYLPPEGTDTVLPGTRVLVPFGRGDRVTQGIVLGEGGKAEENTKRILSLLDDEPILSPDEIRLALWVRSRYYCTCFDAVRLMIPAGLDFKEETVYSVCAEPSDIGGIKNEIAAYISASGGKATLSELRTAFAAPELGRTLSAMVRQGMLTTAEKTLPPPAEKTVRFVRLKDGSFGGKLSKKGAEIVEYLKTEECATVRDVEYYTGASPASLKTLEKNGIVELFEQKADRTLCPRICEDELLPDPILSEQQQKAFSGMLSLALSGRPSAALLHGVTGSGKTAVYIRLVRELVNRSRSAIILVPEIALTPQLLDRFYRSFGNLVALLHSGLTASERSGEWKRIKRGEARVVIGTRSAVFAPVQNLGAIIIDEEQEYTYRSENTPCYHAREVAKFRAVRSEALLVLGSATPSVESMYAAENGKYSLYTLDERYSGGSLPEVIFADMRAELRRGNSSTISPVLFDEIEKNIKNGEQTILFLNRRGRNRLARCASCGEAVGCKNCSVAMSYHSANGRLMCHYCGHSEALTDRCPSCGGMLVLEGAGTQKAAEELTARFPQIKLLRMDADTTSGRTSHETILEKFRNGEASVMIGTQMVAKGLDFDNVTLVGVLDADSELCSPDFRASERAFSQITQVIGRAGRGERPGRAVIQTYTPENPLLRAAATQDYNLFYKGEIDFRRKMNYPPFCDILCLRISGETEATLNAAAIRLARALSASVGGEIIGPAPAPVYRVSNRYRLRIFIKTHDRKELREAVYGVLSDFRGDSRNRGISVTAEINPLE